MFCIFILVSMTMVKFPGHKDIRRIDWGVEGLFKMFINFMYDSFGCDV